MNVKLHIDRMVLDGFTLSRRQSAQVKAAVETQLANMLKQGSGNLRRTSFCAGRLQGRDIRLSGSETPTQLGGHIAGTIYRGIKK